MLVIGYLPPVLVVLIAARLGNLANFAWWRVIRWLRTLHRWGWNDVRRAFTTPQGRF